MMTFCLRYAAVLALFVTAAAAQAYPQFEKNRVGVAAPDSEWSQVLNYNYSEGTVDVSEVKSGGFTNTRDIESDGYIGFFLYDYGVGQFTEEVIVGHDDAYWW